MQLQLSVQIDKSNSENTLLKRASQAEDASFITRLLQKYRKVQSTTDISIAGEKSEWNWIVEWIREHKKESIVLDGLWKEIQSRPETLRLYALKSLSSRSISRFGLDGKSRDRIEAEYEADEFHYFVAHVGELDTKKVEEYGKLSEESKERRIELEEIKEKVKGMDEELRKLKETEVVMDRRIYELKEKLEWMRLQSKK